MSAVGRKLTLNLNKLRKKLTDVPSDASQSELQEHYLHMPTGGSHGDNSPGEGTQGSPREGHHSMSTLSSSPKQKSISMGSISREDGEVVDQDDILHLTQEMKSFSDALAQLKSLFTESEETGEEVRVLAHERLGEVLNLLKKVLQTYHSLNSTDVFSASGTLITKIKNYSYEEENEDEQRELCDAIDQLALAFSSSVSEYVMGETSDSEDTDVKTKSCDNLTSVPGEMTEGEFKQGHLSPEDVNGILAELEAGVDMALQRAKAWSKYSKDVITYVERKAQFEIDYAKSLSRLSQSLRQPLTDEGFLPLQSVYCTSLTQDLDYATSSQATCAVLQAQKFVEPMNSRRAEHDKVRKILKEVWGREMKKMNDAVTNLRKAKSMYIQRHQEFDKARELAQKTESEMLNQSGGLSKIDKRKRLEEDALHRAAEAETTYKACVAEANMRQEELTKVKRVVLAKLQEQIRLSDELMKKVTVDYFQLQIAMSAPIPVQYQALCETCDEYEPGSQYAEFVRRLPLSSQRVTHEPFIFQPYLVDRQPSERKPSSQSNGSGGSEQASHENSPQSMQRKEIKGGPLRAWSQGGLIPGSDTDSASSSRSMDNSPNASPRGAAFRAMLAQSEEDTDEQLNDSGIGQSVETLVGQGRKTVGGVCARFGSRRNTFGVDFNEQVKKTNTEVPPIVSLCLEEIEKRGMDIRGIYRVSGVKSKVEALCQKFDNNPEGVDLSEENPNVISNVLKLYLRQLPEPLLTFRLYPDFIWAGKEDMGGAVDSASTVERLKSIIQKLPKSNFKTCAILMHHLKRLASNVESNQMSCNNLGIVFGPTLLRPKEGTASLTSLVDTPHQTRTVELLISNVEEIFGSSLDYQVTHVHKAEDLSINPDDLSEEEEEEAVGGKSVSRTPSGSVLESVHSEDSISTEKDGSQTFSLPGSTSHESRLTDTSSDVTSEGCRGRVIPVQRVDTLSSETDSGPLHSLDLQSESKDGETNQPTVNIIIPMDSVQALREKVKRDLEKSSSPQHVESPPRELIESHKEQVPPLKSPGHIAKMAFLYNSPPDASKPWGSKFPNKGAPGWPPPSRMSDNSSTNPVYTTMESGVRGNGSRLGMPVPKPYTSTAVVRPVQITGSHKWPVQHTQPSGTGPLRSNKPPITTIAKFNVVQPQDKQISESVQKGTGVGGAAVSENSPSTGPVSYKIPVKYMGSNSDHSTTGNGGGKPATETQTIVIKPLQMSPQELETKYV